MHPLIQTLYENHRLTGEEYLFLLQNRSPQLQDQLRAAAQEVSARHFHHGVYIRGLIEFTNYCKNDCYYCGIRRSNPQAVRYRLTEEDILACCREGYPLGFRTFVLQGGEDPWFTDDRLCHIVSSIKKEFPDCAVTLSVGERSRESYQRLFDAGADRYLLRHETATSAHYAQLHPKELKLEHRMECLSTLKDIGYQVGAGFMVGSPGQTLEHLVTDLLFLQQFQPHMVGIGPFLPHKDTPFGQEPAGDVSLTLYLLSILRLMLPNVMLPATTALGTAAGDGREQGILSGANVVMPNLSPLSVRKKYMLYDNKISTGEEAAEGLTLLEKKLNAIGHHIVVGRGDYREEE